MENEISYHYCSINAGYSILKNRSLWLSNLKSTNDKKELFYGKKIVSKTIDKLSEASGSEYIESLEGVHRASKDQKLVNKFVNTNYYGASFSEYGDNLTHWDRYASSATGVAIGFNLNILKELFDIYRLPNMMNGWFNKGKVVYNENEMIDIILQNLISIIEYFNEMNVKYHENHGIAIYATLLHNVIPNYKHDSFIDEKEIRISFAEGTPENDSRVYSDLFVDEDKELGKIMKKRIIDASKELRIDKKSKQFGLFSTGVRSYYSLNLEKIWSSKLVPEIIIGPKSTQDIREFKQFLKSVGLKGTKVKVSDIPYR
ncbi:DUF2971 domain-containing protein [Acidaminobacter sp. JC074]|uniref:DUF2971 domain-containing protein n=1 Tax=Acidaminobacter sp. JC074 TaxID=2530199 RepID=UPI001F104069|nr:DUF2971 domain-containing protein [Acidaminobacter sp. JC074]MCH4888944.1 DUF2971 domain-containing protein [Acidaminobacter sp. JC074]